MNISLSVLIFIILCGVCIILLGFCGFTGNLYTCSASVIVCLIIIISSVIYYYTQIRNKDNNDNNDNKDNN